MLSSLQLKGHRLASIEVHADPKGLAQGSVALATQVGWARIHETPGDWRVTLQVRFSSADSKNPAPYHGAVEIVGIFTVDPTWPAARTEELVRVNGASLLYGAVRETLLLLTSRATHGEFLLPTLSFINGAQPATPAKPSRASSRPKTGKPLRKTP